MSKLKFEISISVDGYVAGPNQGEEHPLGKGEPTCTSGGSSSGGGPGPWGLVQERVVHTPEVTHVKYRVSR